MSERVLVAAIQIGVDQPADHLVVDVVRGVGLGREVEVAVRRDALGPFGHQRVGLLPAGRVAGRRVHPRQPGDDLAEDAEHVAAVPSAEIVARRGQSGPLAKALQQVVVGDAQVIVADLVQLHPHPPAVERHAAIVEVFKPLLALDGNRLAAGGNLCNRADNRQRQHQNRTDSLRCCHSTIHLLRSD